MLCYLFQEVEFQKFFSQLFLIFVGTPFILRRGYAVNFGNKNMTRRLVLSLKMGGILVREVRIFTISLKQWLLGLSKNKPGINLTKGAKISEAQQFSLFKTKDVKDLIKIYGGKTKGQQFLHATFIS